MSGFQQSGFDTFGGNDVAMQRSLLEQGTMVGGKINRVKINTFLMVGLGLSSIVLFLGSLWPVVYGSIDDWANGGVNEIREIWYWTFYCVVTMGAAIAGLYTILFHNAEGARMKWIATGSAIFAGSLALLAFAHGGVFAGIYEGIRWARMGAGTEVTAETLQTWLDHKSLWRANYFIIVLVNGLAGGFNGIGFLILAFLIGRGNRVYKGE